MTSLLKEWKVLLFSYLLINFVDDWHWITNKIIMTSIKQVITMGISLKNDVKILWFMFWANSGLLTSNLT